jgi:hypothetical protein
VFEQGGLVERGRIRERELAFSGVELQPHTRSASSRRRRAGRRRTSGRTARLRPCR